MSQKIADLERLTDEVCKLGATLKDKRAKKNVLSAWLKQTLEKEAIRANTDKVQAEFGKAVYTVTRKKEFLGKAPTQKQIPTALEQFFDPSNFDNQAFLVMSPKEKADAVWKSIWGSRKKEERTTITRKITK